jgi:hypothetical protein
VAMRAVLSRAFMVQVLVYKPVNRRTNGK